MIPRDYDIANIAIVGVQLNCAEFWCCNWTQSSGCCGHPPPQGFFPTLSIPTVIQLVPGILKHT